jgi:hypothetical protein
MYIFFFFFETRSPYIAQSGFRIHDPPASTSYILGLHQPCIPFVCNRKLTVENLSILLKIEFHLFIYFFSARDQTQVLI